jgi:hypothetical protein
MSADLLNLDACWATLKTGRGNYVACGATAAAIIQVGCVHEHVQTLNVCDEHTYEGTADWATCKACRVCDEPHHCHMVARIRDRWEVSL